jgi:CDGSH-type Zn-finger protein
MATKITVKNHGSIRLEWENPGEVKLQDASGKDYDLGERTSVSLCRCGASLNKPFCDGAHSRCGFQSEVVASILPAPKKA